MWTTLTWPIIVKYHPNQDCWVIDAFVFWRLGRYLCGPSRLRMGVDSADLRRHRVQQNNSQFNVSIACRIGSYVTDSVRHGLQNKNVDLLMKTLERTVPWIWDETSNSIPQIMLRTAVSVFCSWRNVWTKRLALGTRERPPWRSRRWLKLKMIFSLHWGFHDFKKRLRQICWRTMASETSLRVLLRPLLRHSFKSLELLRMANKTELALVGQFSHLVRKAIRPSAFSGMRLWTLSSAC